MRTRKNIKLSSSSSPQVCQLNQSTWDVMPLSPLSQSPDHSQSDQHQYQGIHMLSSVAIGASMGSDFIEEEEKEKAFDGSGTERKCEEEQDAKRKKSSKVTDTRVETRRRNLKRDASCFPIATSDYYFYSGFGPQWGKKRGEAHLRTAPPPSSSSHDVQGHGNKENGTTYKKKSRKPIKTRSLKFILSK